MMLVPSSIQILEGIAPLAGRYDAWLCDVWGVMHNGVSPFATAGEAARRFRGRGGTVVLISNSPRPSEQVVAQMKRIGVPEGAWDGVVTSGDVTRALIGENRDKTLYHLGPERDDGLFEGLDLAFAGPETAQLVVCSGLREDDHETPENYRDLLSQLAARDLPMICANPDLMVERGDRLVYCAGALAAAYEALGGEVTYPGKPHAPIYDQALKLIGEIRGEDVPRERVLAIGDGLRTDMAGAAAAGIDSLFVASGLHLGAAGSRGAATQGEIDKLFEGSAVRPVGALSRLVW